MITRERPRGTNILKPVGPVGSASEEPKTAAFVREPGREEAHKDPQLSAFGFQRNPFPVVPDANAFYLSRRSEAILAEVLHSIESRKGFLVLTGEVGLGKTTLSRRILMELEERGIRAALVFNTFHQGADLLREINRDFGIDAPSDDLSSQMAELNRFLLANLAAGTNCAIIIDDAQQLSVASLELVRQVSNLETDSEKLVQILLIGQPELDETLESYELRQLASRIVLSRRVEALSLEETTQYVEHKLALASGHGRLKVTPAAFRLLQKLSGGNPRRINALMDRSLYAAIVFDTDRIDRPLLAKAAEDARPGGSKPARTSARRIAQSAVLILAVILLATLLLGKPLARESASAVWAAVSAKLSAPVPSSSAREGVTAEPEAIAAAAEPEARVALSPMPAEIAQATTADRELESQAVADPISAPPFPTEDPVETVEAFLGAYGLGRHSAEFGEALNTGWLDEVGAKIRLDSGLRLVSLPALADGLEQYPVFTWSHPDLGTEEFLLFWRPRNWSPANQYFQYREPEVRAMQRALQGLDLYHGDIDGLPGPMTSTALRRFQTSMDLRPSGVPDATTMFLLELRGGPGESEGDQDGPLGEGDLSVLSLPVL